MDLSISKGSSQTSHCSSSPQITPVETNNDSITNVPTLLLIIVTDIYTAICKLEVDITLRKSEQAIQLSVTDQISTDFKIILRAFIWAVWHNLLI